MGSQNGSGRPPLSSFYREKFIREYNEERERRGVDFGECFCGCGAKTRLTISTSRFVGRLEVRALGHFPKRFIAHHHKPKCRQQYLEEDRGYSTPCWIWQRTCMGSGDRYGVASDGKGGQRAAHIVFFEAKFGPVPRGCELDHLCRVRRCCNPDHLEPVTHQVNVVRGKVARFTADDIRSIIALRKSGECFRRIAVCYDTTLEYIQKICAGDRWCQVALECGLPVRGRRRRVDQELTTETKASSTTF